MSHFDGVLLIFINVFDQINHAYLIIFILFNFFPFFHIKLIMLYATLDQSAAP